METFDANKPIRHLVPVTDDEGLVYLFGWDSKSGSNPPE
jgi:hypothetical protein